MKALDLTGKRFGRLVAVRRVENSRTGSARWECECDCGELKIVNAGSLNYGDTQSCGCLSREKRAERARAQSKKASAARSAKAMSPEERTERVRAQRRAAHRRRRNDPEYKAKVAARSHANYVSRKFGITVDEYRALLAEGCAICGATPDEVRVELDHDHASGKVRSALCGPCNTGLGRFRDNPDRLRAAAAYIEAHS